jgi:hypothetical protein
MLNFSMKNEQRRTSLFTFVSLLVWSRKSGLEASKAAPCYCPRIPGVAITAEPGTASVYMQPDNLPRNDWYSNGEEQDGL